MEIKRREPYDKNHVMYYKDLEEFLYQNWKLDIAKEQKYQLYQVYIMTTEYRERRCQCNIRFKFL